MPDHNRPGKTKQPRKSRKRLHEADHKERRKQMSAHLSEDLMLEYDRRSMPVREGDTVEIVRGDFAGHEGEILEVDRGRREIEIDGVSNRRADGTQVPRPIHPSNVIITDLHLTDPQRRAALERKGVTVEEPEPEPEEEEEAEEETEATSEIAEEAAAGPDREPPEPEPEPELEPESEEEAEEPADEAEPEAEEPADEAPSDEAEETEDISEEPDEGDEPTDDEASDDAPPEETPDVTEADEEAKDE